MLMMLTSDGPNSSARVEGMRTNVWTAAGTARRSRTRRAGRPSRSACGGTRVGGAAHCARCRRAAAPGSSTAG